MVKWLVSFYRVLDQDWGRQEGGRDVEEGQRYREKGVKVDCPSSCRPKVWMTERKQLLGQEVKGEVATWKSTSSPAFPQVTEAQKTHEYPPAEGGLCHQPPGSPS